jgi:hypothetical protein
MKNPRETLFGVIDAFDKTVSAAESLTLRGQAALPLSAQWGLALAAMYTRVHGYGDRALEPWSDVKRDFSMALLKEWWGIDGDTPAKRRDQAVGVLDWLAKEGHRTDDRYVEPGDREAPKDLLAWDVARLVMVARNAFLSTYITEEEGWAYVREATKMAQANFSSWKDYANRYDRGRHRWSGGPEQAFDGAVDFLLKDEKSPWRKLDWNTPLNDDDFRNPVKIASKNLRARGQKARLYVLMVAAPLLILGAIIQSMGKNSSLDHWWKKSSTQSAQQYSAPASSTLFPTPLKQFSDIDISFLGARDKIFASLSNAVIMPLDAIVVFRYGVNIATPDKSREGTVPSVLELPSDTRFLTIQAQFRDGKLSPIRRFDVPASLLKSK